MLKLKIKVPEVANSFSFNINFFGAEYPQTVCSGYNDFFVVLLDSEFNEKNPGSAKKNPWDKNLAMDADKNPVGINMAPLGVFKWCDPAYHSYDDPNDPNDDEYSWINGCMESVTVNNQTLKGTDMLKGTGYHDGESARSMHGSTAWMRVQGNVVPGETINLRIALWEMGHVGYESDMQGNSYSGPDRSYDTTVLLDNFKWDVDVIDPGTVSDQH